MNSTSLEDRFEAIDIIKAAPLDRYKMLMASIVPRPIAFVSTLNDEDKANLAPFSNFMLISSSRAIMAFSVGGTSGGNRLAKDTLNHIRKRGEYVINLAPDTLAMEVQACSEDFPPDVSEADKVGLTMLASHVIKTPRIAECTIQYECNVEDIRQYGEAHLVVGHAVYAHARKGLVREFKIDPREYAPLARIGGRVYCKLGDLINV